MTKIELYKYKERYNKERKQKVGVGEKVIKQLNSDSKYTKQNKNKLYKYMNGMIRQKSLN